MTIQLRPLDRRELPGFRPYLLPDTLSRLDAGRQNIFALGAVSGRSALGAAAVRLEDGSAELTDLFVDTQARRMGVGGVLLDSLLDRLAELGVSHVTADYALRDQELAAMDALLESRGFTPPSIRSHVFTAQAADFKEDRRLGTAFSARYRTPDGVIPISTLPPAALAELETDDTIPDYLSWSTLKKYAQPELSVAFLQDGKVLAYLIGGDSADGGGILMAAFRREGGPLTAFLPLLREQVNRCYYRFGGDFPYYFSALTPQVEKLALHLMGDRFVRCEEHTSHFTFPPMEPGSQS